MDAQRQIRENSLELHDFLNDLKSWEQTMKERDKKLRTEANQEKPSSLPPVRGRRQSTSVCSTGPPVQQNAPEPLNETKIQPAAIAERKNKPKNQSVGIAQTTKGLSYPFGAAGHTYDSYRDKWDKFDVEAALRETDGEDTGKLPTGDITNSKNISTVGQLENVDRLSSALGLSEHLPDALSEKELGNEYFKEKKFVQAVECYSRSIALQPSAVAYANRAMACIKIRRYEEAELDCTEAIALDDRYVKAYSRRGMARKERGNFLGAVEDFEFALRLEPQSKELQMQYMEARALCEKNAGIKLPQKKVSLPIQEIGSHVQSRAFEEGRNTEKNEMGGQNLTRRPQAGLVPPSTVVPESNLHVKKNVGASMSDIVNKQLLVKQEDDLASTQAAAARAAANAMTALAQKIIAPKTSYEFESLWKSFSGSKTAQAELLKIMNPSTLPGVFKDSLTAQMLVDIIFSLEQLLPDHANHAVEILENLTKVARFSMTVMCLTSKDKAGLRELWDRVLLSGQVSSELHDTLSKLHSKFRL